MAYIHMGRKHKPKANSAAGSSPLSASPKKKKGDSKPICRAGKARVLALS